MRYLLSFNRTFMELKFVFEIAIIIKTCFNRTFMELKWATVASIQRVGKGFNRTFMELKCRNAT